MKVYGDLLVKGTLNGINFTDGVHTTPNTSKLAFSYPTFYISTGKTTGIPQVNLSLKQGIDILDGTRTYLNQQGIDFSPNFYLSMNSSGTAPVVNLRNPINKSIVLEFPGAAENIMMFRAHEAMRIVSGRAVVVGASSPSVTLLIQSGTARNSVGGTTHVASTTVSSISTGDPLPISTAVIPAGSWVVLETTATTGSVFELDVSLQVEWV